MTVELEQAVSMDERSSSGVEPPSHAPNWVVNLQLFWNGRRLLFRIAAIAFVVSLGLSLVIPKMYVSEARLMPPENSGSSSMLYAAIAQRALGSDALAGLATSLMGGHSSGALFINLLQSSSVTDRVIDRFNLMHVYGKRYRVDAAKTLTHRTKIEQDKKSGVLTLSVEDTDPTRARDMAQAYLEALDSVVNRTSTSSAHQERVFIEKRLQEVKGNLTRAENAMSEFSSTHSAIDLKEQARATVESQARVEGELVAARSELDSLRQVYGDENVRVRTTQARISSLQRQLEKMGGTSAPLATLSGEGSGSDNSLSYLPLRQVPRLAVPYANLYREVHVQETVFDLLTQQYEVARIQEAKDIPAVTLIDAPGIPEKKSFPPRAVVTLALTMLTVLCSCIILICREAWLRIDPSDPRRRLGHDVAGSMRRLLRRRRAMP
ncbi:MAG TPA: Wzz/FepE/Etk N-terminal domain-containing protein [Terracidiphilus sp.]|jgi:capsule polysaccharide export protein KpsE/RkpR